MCIIMCYALEHTAMFDDVISTLKCRERETYRVAPPPLKITNRAFCLHHIVSPEAAF